MNSDTNILNEILINWAKSEENSFGDDTLLKVNHIKNKITDQYGNYKSLTDWKNTAIEFEKTVIDGFLEYFLEKYPEYKQYTNNSDSDTYNSTWLSYSSPNNYESLGEIFVASDEIQRVKENNDDFYWFTNSDDLAYESLAACKIIARVCDYLGLYNEDNTAILCFSRVLNGILYEVTEDAYSYWDYESISCIQKDGKTNGTLMYKELYNYFKNKTQYKIFDNISQIFGNDIIKDIINEYYGTDIFYFIITDSKHKKFTICFYVYLNENETIFFIDFAYKQI